MKINKANIPIKLHYFFFLGCKSPVFPFMSVVARQMGISLDVQGTLQAIILLTTVFAKPLMAAAADTFSKFRKLIFIATLAIMIISMSSIWFIPNMRPNSHIAGKSFVIDDDLELLMNYESFSVDEYNNRTFFYLLNNNPNDCYISDGFDCELMCTENSTCLMDDNYLILSKLDIKMLNTGEIRNQINETLFENFFNESYVKVYKIGNVIDYSLLNDKSISLQCKGSLWEGKNCPSLTSNGYLYLYFFLLLIGSVFSTTSNSITDAICMDSIDNDSHYGFQRAWGAIGWGVMAPISGLLVDVFSGQGNYKNYLPAFILHIFLGITAVIIASIFLKIKHHRNDSTVWKNMQPLLKQKKFIVFLAFVVLNGIFHVVVPSYIFILQDDMAKNTRWVRYLKLLNGLTIFLQCSIEAPFMFISSWLMKRVSAEKIISMVFFFHIFRLLGLALVGEYGPVWGTLVVELLHGPCFGLGYTAIIVYAGKITPPGTSATVQSVVNVCYGSLGSGLAHFVGGLIFHSLGGPTMYFNFGLCAIVTFFFHLAASRLLASQDEDKHITDDIPGNENETRAEDKDESARMFTEENSLRILSPLAKPEDFDDDDEDEDSLADLNRNMPKSTTEQSLL